MRSTFLAMALVSAVPVAARADVVVLKDGERVEGIVAERGGQVEVRLDFGTISFDRSEIDRVEKSSTPLGTVEARHAALPPRDVEGRYRLALEAEKAGLDAFARGLYREVIELSADHKGARAALGYRRQDGAWMTEDEYMTSQGYVRHSSGWITRDAALALEKAESDRRLAEAEAAVRRAEAARLNLLEAEVAAARADAAAARAEASDRVDASAAFPLWAPYWTGTRWDHRHAGGSVGLSVGLGGRGVGVGLGVSGGLPQRPSLPRGASRPQPAASPAPRVSVKSVR